MDSCHCVRRLNKRVAQTMTGGRWTTSDSGEIDKKKRKSIGKSSAGAVFILCLVLCAPVLRLKVYRTIFVSVSLTFSHINTCTTITLPHTCTLLNTMTYKKLNLDVKGVFSFTATKCYNNWAFCQMRKIKKIWKSHYSLLMKHFPCFILLHIE